ncbi:hypothetical protein OIU76_023759 [Salix suchowensis]|nr:hypothetical protein OIU76_023759 [Salix suchowensis]
MAALMKYPSPLFLFVSFALLYPSLCAPEDQITSCLTRQDINNFTTFPRTKQDEDSTRYYKLFNFSIQNLRFTKPTIAKPLAIILPESSDELVKSVMCCREGLLEIRHPASPEISTCHALWEMVCRGQKPEEYLLHLKGFI